MVWVGDKSIDENKLVKSGEGEGEEEEEAETDKSKGDTCSFSSQNHWIHQTSVLQENLPGNQRSSQAVKLNTPDNRPSTRPFTEMSLDFDVLVSNVKQLNMLAGEGVARIQRTKDGAKLTVSTKYC